MRWIFRSLLAGAAPPVLFTAEQLAGNLVETCRPERRRASR